jgi:hypothetical protein
LVGYTKSRGLPVDTLWNKINNLDVALSYRMSGFVDQQQQKFLLDSKTPEHHRLAYLFHLKTMTLFLMSAPLLPTLPTAELF